MPIHRVTDDVENGVRHLDNRYPGWWVTIHLPLLNMGSATNHVLCYASKFKLQDTFEWTFWSRAALQACGFVPRGSVDHMDVLTATWVVRISEIKEERK